MIFIAAPVIVQDQQPPLSFNKLDRLSIKTPPTLSRADFEILSPSTEELKDFKFAFSQFSETDRSSQESLKENRCYYFYSWTAKRNSDQLTFYFQIAITLDPNRIGMVSMLAPTSIVNPPLVDGSFTGKPIGRYAYSYPLSLLVEDGWVLMKFQFMPTLLKKPEGGYSIPALSDTDKAWAEEIGRKILDRATVQGLTSRPAASAPLWAKEQVAKRRAERKQ
jgi:hypothetical protein